MLKGEIKAGKEYAFREKRGPGVPLQRVKVIERIRGRLTPEIAAATVCARGACVRESCRSARADTSSSNRWVGHRQRGRLELPNPRFIIDCPCHLP